MKLLKRILPPLGILFFLSGTIWFSRFKILKIYFKSDWERSSSEPVLKEIEKVFMEDRQILSQYAIFKPSKGTNDAGPFLNSQLHWEIGEIYHEGPLVLPPLLHNELRTEWVEKRPLFKKMGLNFDWIKQLHQYDFWSPEENSPAYPVGFKYLPDTYPVPTYSDLLVWAKLRLLYGKENKDIQNAFKDVRHLARLIGTNDYMISNAIMLNLLKIERQFYDSLSSEQKGGWQVIPEEVQMRAKRHFKSLPGLVDIRFTDKMFQKITNTDVGICQMISQGLVTYILVRDLLKDEFPKKFERMNKLVKETQAKKCRKTIIHQIWEDPTWPSPIAEDQMVFGDTEGNVLFNDSFTWGELKKHYDQKVVVGYFLFTVAGPDFFSDYQK
jgi:hypothetical protein